MRLLPMLAIVALSAAPLAAQQPDPLADLVREGLRANLGLERERLATAQADLDVTRARGLFLPSLAIDARYSEQTGTLDLGQFVNPAYRTLNGLTGSNAFPTDLSVTLPLNHEAKLRLTQPVFNAAILANHALARSRREAQHGRLAAARRDLAAGVQLGYFQTASAGRTAELYRATIEVLEENLRVTERLVAEGSATPDAVSRARADLSETRQQLADAERARLAAARALNQLLDRPLDAPLPVYPDSLFDRPLDLSPDDALRQALARREEVAAAEHGIAAAEAETRLAGAAFLPSVSLALDYGFQGTSLSYGGDNDYAVASVVVQWNLFNGGQDAARRDQARLEAERARAARRELETRIAVQVRTAYDAAATARAAIGTSEERLEAARRTFELVRRRYEEGLASHLEFTEARSALTSAGLNAILTRYTYATRQVELERAAALRTLEP